MTTTRYYRYTHFLSRIAIAAIIAWLAVVGTGLLGEKVTTMWMLSPLTLVAAPHMANGKLPIRLVALFSLFATPFVPAPYLVASSLLFLHVRLRFIILVVLSALQFVLLVSDSPYENYEQFIIVAALVAANVSLFIAMYLDEDFQYDRQ